MKPTDQARRRTEPHSTSNEITTRCQKAHTAPKLSPLRSTARIGTP